MIADRVNTVNPFLVMEVLERAKEMEKEGSHIVHMEVGEPDFDTPAYICEAAKLALGQGYTHYTHSLGDLELREEISAYYKKRYNVDVPASRILAFSGTSPAMMLLFSCILNPGDEVILSNPCYACYPSFVKFSGGVCAEVLTQEDDGFQYRPDDVKKKINNKTKAILINSPSNPTGILLEPSRMKELAELGPMIVSDEIYHGLTYEDAPEHSILEFTDNAVVIGGFSKSFAMTGWRLGYLIVPEELVRPMQILMQNFFISPNAAVQRAGIVALRHISPEIEEMRNTYNERRKLLLNGLKDIGFSIPIEPKGAFYMMINARHISNDSVKLAFDILEKAKVGVTPGVDFGSQTEGFLRLSYATSFENIQEALLRIKNYIRSL